MKQTAPQFKVRLPPPLKAWVQSQAAANHRTMTAEITHRLEIARLSEASRPSGGAPAAGEPARV